MLIDIGYDMELAFNAPNALVSLLPVYADLEHDLQAPENSNALPVSQMHGHCDPSDNGCGHMDVPASLSAVGLANRARIGDSGRPSVVHYGATWPTCSALHTFHAATSGCRDFATLAVISCRGIKISTRYGTAYLGDLDKPPVRYPMEFSAWFAVFLSGQWLTFDARQDTPCIGWIMMAMGRDVGAGSITMTFCPNTLTRFKVTTDEVF